jgi:hypothetical protein
MFNLVIWGVILLLSVAFNVISSKDLLCMWAYNSNTYEYNRIKSRSRSDAVGIAATLRNTRFAVPKSVGAREFSLKHRDWLWGKHLSLVSRLRKIGAISLQTLRACMA